MGSWCELKSGALFAAELYYTVYFLPSRTECDSLHLFYALILCVFVCVLRINSICSQNETDTMKYMFCSLNTVELMFNHYGCCYRSFFSRCRLIYLAFSPCRQCRASAPA